MERGHDQTVAHLFTLSKSDTKQTNFFSNAVTVETRSFLTPNCLHGDQTSVRILGVFSDGRRSRTQEKLNENASQTQRHFHTQMFKFLANNNMFFFFIFVTQFKMPECKFPTFVDIPVAHKTCIT